MQIDMASAFSHHGYFYERKPREFDGRQGIDVNNIIPNELVGQSYLAVVLKKPSDASRRKYKVWDDCYNQIFSGSVIEPHVIALEVYRHTIKWLRREGHMESKADLHRKIARNAAFHIARIACQLWQGSGWENNLTEMQNSISLLKLNPNAIDMHLTKSMKLLTKIITKNEKFFPDPDAALKSGELDREIDCKLS